jgi:hypothetical protein
MGKQLIGRVQSVFDRDDSDSLSGTQFKEKHQFIEAFESVIERQEDGDITFPKF